MTSTVPSKNLSAVHNLFPLEPGHCIYNFQSFPLPLSIFIDFKGADLPLIVFGQGMAHRERYSLPRFQRMNWTGSFSANIIILNDPTLYLNDCLKLGWMLGTDQWYATYYILEIIKDIAQFIGLSSKNILFYGSSAGGFTSLMMASMCTGASAFVNNPQTNILNFRRGGVRDLIKFAFPGYTEERLKQELLHRFSFIEHLKQGHGAFPRLYFLQNLCDDDHRCDQMFPFLEFVQGSSLNSGIIGPSLDCPFILDLYNCSTSLHNPIGLHTTISKMKTCLDWIQI